MISPGTTWDAPRYKELTVAPQELVEDVLEVVHDAYNYIVQFPRKELEGISYEDVKRSPSCFEVSSFVTKRLNESDKGYHAMTRQGYFPTSRLYLTPHRTSKVSVPELTDGILVDATWQQFLACRSVGRRIKDTLREAELSSHTHRHGSRSCANSARRWL